METKEEVTIAAAPDVALTRIELIVSEYEAVDEDSYSRGGDILKSIARAKKMWKEYWKEPITAAKVALAEVTRRERHVTDKIDRLKALVEGRMSDYRMAAFKRTAELEEKIQQEAEEQRKKLIIQGKIAESQLLPDKVQLAPPQLKLEGVPTRKVDDIYIDDLMALVKSIAAGEVPLEYEGMPMFDVKVSVIHGLRRIHGEDYQIPGVRVEQRISYRTRG